MNIRVIKLIKLNVIFIYSFCFTHINARRFHLGGSWLYSFKKRLPQGLKWYIICRKFRSQLGFINKHRDAFINNKHNVTAEFYISHDIITTCIYNLAFISWLCEKMKITNVKFKFLDKDVSDLFESCPNNDKTPTTIRQKISWSLPARGMSKHCSPSEIGYTMFSKLPVRKELKEQADDYLNRHIKGDWVAVHYRGTDLKTTETYRYIEPDLYIRYLKEVLDSRYRIFVCSDQAQFINMMEVAFPGRVFSRDIQRSDSDNTLHQHPRYRGSQQKRDAMVDMLVLAKAELIYTTGSSFASVIRFFNPKVKIVSLCGLRERNHILVPRRDLYDTHLFIKR